MSEPANPQVPAAEEPRPKGRPWGTIFGRVLMALLIVLVAIEANAKFGYDRTLTALRTKADKLVESTKDGRAELEDWSIPMPEAEKCISGFPSKTRRMQFHSPVVDLKWLSLFKTYVIHLHLDDDNVVNSLSTEDIE